jgi:ribosomal protein L16/L10AE
LNLNFLIKKNHIFKRRIKATLPLKFYSNLSTGLYNLKKIRFEFVYLKVFKKIFRKKYFKKKPIFFCTKFWMMIKPNFILSMKSKNSRMGSGVGIYTRVCSILKPGKPIMLLKGYSKNFVKKAIHYFKLKLNINVSLILKSNYIKM